MKHLRLFDYGLDRYLDAQVRTSEKWDLTKQQRIFGPDDKLMFWHSFFGGAIDILIHTYGVEPDVIQDRLTDFMNRKDLIQDIYRHQWAMGRNQHRPVSLERTCAQEELYAIRFRMKQLMHKVFGFGVEMEMIFPFTPNEEFHKGQDGVQSVFFPTPFIPRYSLLAKHQKT